MHQLLLAGLLISLLCLSTSADQHIRATSIPSQYGQARKELIKANNCVRGDPACPVRQARLVEARIQHARLRDAEAARIEQWEKHTNLMVAHAWTGPASQKSTAGVLEHEIHTHATPKAVPDAVQRAQAEKKRKAKEEIEAYTKQRTEAMEHSKRFMQSGRVKRPEGPRWLSRLCRICGKGKRR